MIVRPLTLALALGLLACGSAAEDPPDRDPVGPTDPAPGRRVRRLTADQFARSLQVATGQAWTRWASPTSASSPMRAPTSR